VRRLALARLAQVDEGRGHSRAPTRNRPTEFAHVDRVSEVAAVGRANLSALTGPECLASFGRTGAASLRGGGWQARVAGEPGFPTTQRMCCKSLIVHRFLTAADGFYGDHIHGPRKGMLARSLS
jgi:hypothetical protein